MDAATAAAAAAPVLSALAVFASTVEHGAVRSVHGYKFVGKGGRGRWEKWVEREFAFSPYSCHEVHPPVAAPRILPSEWRGRPVYREGQMVVFPWRCILAFDSVAAFAPPPTLPPVLSPVMNPRLKCVPSLYNDLSKLLRFQSVGQKAPVIIQRRSVKKLTSSAAKVKTSDKVDASGSQSDENPQSGEEPEAPAPKARRANRKHIASITLVDIAQHFHLPIREASSTLKIGVSILKKKCRQYGIPRWPHRKIKSLDNLIHDLEYVIDDTERDDVQQEKHRQTVQEKHRQTEQEKHRKKEQEKREAIIALTRRKRMLETEKENIQQKPSMDLLAETKLFREDVFKRRYRAKSILT